MYTVVSRARTHGRSTINPHFSPYWALAKCTGRLQCVNFEIDLDCINFYGRGTCRYTRAHAHMHTLCQSLSALR